MAKAAVRTIIFVASPTGAYDLAYSVGEIADFDVNQAQELVESGYANYYDPKEASEEVTE